MKVQAADRQIMTNAQNESQFMINPTPQAFKLLSDGLYEHKVAAIVRELSCNAWDSHVDAGIQDQPFKVVLPNNLHPYFEIEDYGIGLDDDGVRNVYTSYFTSTKQQSNDSVGCFGLGSKTPFAYTTSFTIRARKDGIERLYSAYLGNSGAPCVNLLSEINTNDNNGVKITVPVKPYDHDSFHDEAKFILSFFGTMPIVTDPNFEVAYPGIVNDLEEDDFVLKDRSETGSSLYNGNLYAVMGGVCYRLNYTEVEDPNLQKYINDVMLREVRRYSYSGKVAFIRFQIGDLEVAASRETLSMNDQTRQALSDKIEKIARIRRVKDQQEIDQYNHPVKAYEHAAEMYSSFVAQNGGFTYNGVGLNIIANSKLNSYYDIEYCFDEKSRRANKPKVKKYERVSIGSMVERSVEGIYYKEGSKKSHIIRYMRDYLIDKQTMVVLCKEPMTEQKLNRVDAYLGVQVQWHDLDDLKQQYPLPKKNTVRVSRGGNHLTSESVLSVSIEFIGAYNDIRYMGENVIELDPNNVYYINKIHRSEERISFYCNSLERMVSLPFMDFDKIIGNVCSNPNELRLIPYNQRTKSKIDKVGVKSVDEIVQKFLDKHLDKVKASELVRSVCYEDRKLIEKVSGLGIKWVNDQFKDIQNTLEHNQSLIMTSRFDMFFFDREEINQEKTQLREKTEKCRKALLDRYPMLTHWPWDHLDQSCVKDYMKLVEESLED